MLPVQDGLGNVTDVLDQADGKVVARYDYGPYGEPLGESGEVDACPFRYQTKFYDAESQHYYFGYRYYDPRLGRWLSRDPKGEAGGFNLYAYCGNDPVNGHDPLGLEERIIDDWHINLYADEKDSSRVFLGFGVEEDSLFGPFQPTGREWLSSSSVRICDAPEILKNPLALRYFKSGAALHRQNQTFQKRVFYVGNGLRVVGGVLGAAGSVAFAPVSLGGSLAGFALSFDQAWTGAAQIWEGPGVDVQTTTSKLLQLGGYGMSRSDAEKCEFGLNFVAPGSLILKNLAIKVPLAPVSGLVDHPREGTRFFRKIHGLGPGVNCAGVEYIDESGQLARIFAMNEGDLHAERILDRLLREAGVPSENVMRIYSELKPCAGKFTPQFPGGCRNLLRYRFPDADVEFDYTNPLDLWRDLRDDGLIKLLTRKRR